MDQKIKILHLEDDEEDVIQLKWILNESHFNFELYEAKNKEEYIKGLSEFNPDMVIADNSIPDIETIDALDLSLHHDLKMPFIVLSGTVSEEFAVEIVKQGAFDYVFKSNIHRLTHTISRGIEFKHFEEEREKYLNNVIENEELLNESEKMSHLGSWQLDLTTNEARWSDEAYRIYGLEPGEITPSYELFLSFIHPDDIEMVKNLTSDTFGNSVDSIKFNFRIITSNGDIKHIRNEMILIRNKEKVPVKLVGFNLDITEQVEAQQALIKRERFYKKLIEKSTDIKMLLSQDNGIIYASPAFYQILGYNEQNTNEIKFSSLLHPADAGKFEIDLSATANIDDNFSILLRIKNNTGAYHWIEGTVTNYLQDPDINAFVVNGRDVTKQIENRHKLEQSESHLQASQRIGNIGSWELNLISSDPVKYGFSYWSDETFRIFGYEPGEVEITADFFISRVHPDERSTIRETTRKAIFQSDFYESDHRIIRKDGEIRIVQNKVHIIREPLTGTCTKIIGVVHDITETRAVRDASIKSEANLKTVLNNTEISYVLMDTDLTIRYFNESANEGFIRELGKNIVVGTNALDYFTSERRTRLEENCNIVLSGKKIYYETSYKINESRTLWYDNQLTPVKDNNNQILGMLMARTDITERKILDIKREKITEDLMQRNKDLEQFAYITSHNLRGPVANIIGSVNLLQEGIIEKDELAQFYQGLRNAASKLDVTIKDLNNILHTRNAIFEKKEPVKISDLVQEVNAGMQEMIEQEDVIFNLDFEGWNEIHTIKSYLHSIFYNLITNSIKYRKPDEQPVIGIKTVVSGPHRRIIIKDNGLGLDTNKFGGQVFGLYKRFHLHKEGKGMGLFMVKTQVETLGGRIQLISEENQGCEFIIDFK